MKRAVQKRTLETRAKLVAAAHAVVAQAGYEGLRVEEVVSRAGVAKGTFFAHFRDKDALMDQLIGAKIDALLDDVSTADTPQTVSQAIDVLQPVHDFMTCERYVFDVILRYSGATAVSEIGPIAMTFGKYLSVVEDWIKAGSFRQDIDSALVAEGVQAFAVQAMALKFCALHQEQSHDARLQQYLDAWLHPA